MISLLRSNRLIKILSFISLLFFYFNPAIAANDIWKKDEKKNNSDNEIQEEEDITIESPILSEDINKIVIKIDENKIDENEQSVIGIFDPEENNFNLDMWLRSDGEYIKKVLKRIDKE